MREFDYPADDSEPENRIEINSRTLKSNEVVMFDDEKVGEWIQSDAWLTAEECR